MRKGGQYAGLPERLAQQLSKISRNAPELLIGYVRTPLGKITKAMALQIETKNIWAYADKIGIPIGNVSRIKKYMNLYKTAGMTNKSVKALSKFLKF